MSTILCNTICISIELFLFQNSWLEALVCIDGATIIERASRDCLSSALILYLTNLHGSLNISLRLDNSHRYDFIDPILA